MKEVNIKSIISEKKVLFLDCFDTILFRTCSSEKIYEEWLLEVAKVFNTNYIDTSKIWKDILSQQTIWCEGEDESSFFKLCSEFYFRLSYLEPLNITSNDFYEKVLLLMIEIELKRVIVNPEILNIILFARKCEIKLYCLTDFYLPKSAIKCLFKKLKLDLYFCQIYVSSEIGKRKSTGQLYSYVLEQEKISAQDVLMMGDNKRSDVVIPKKLGIDAIYYKGNKAYRKVAKLYSKNLDIIFKNNNKRKMPYANYCFSLYCFCKKLHEELISKGETKVYFFAREGEFLKKLFDEYLKLVNENQIETRYLIVSRQSTYLASLKVLEKEQFEILKKQFTKLTIEDFLKSLGLLKRIRECTDLQKKYDFSFSIQNPWDSDLFLSFCKEESFASIYEEERKKANLSIRSYFVEQGICEGDNVNVVDIGWKGTIQDNIFNIFQGNINLQGYYYGLLGKITLENNNKKYGLIFSSIPVFNDEFNNFCVNYRMLERVLYASHGSCLAYENKKVVLNKMGTKEKELYHFVKEIQDIVIEDVKLIEAYSKKANLPRSLEDYILTTYHGKYVLEFSLLKFKQMSYMDKRQEMSFINYESMKQKKYDILKNAICLVKQKKLFELLNKIMYFMHCVHLGIIAKVMGKFCSTIYSFRRKKWEISKLQRI